MNIKYILLIPMTAIMLSYAYNINKQLENAPPTFSNYCQMVEIYKSTNGDFGWPDYKKLYSVQCEVSK